MTRRDFYNSIINGTVNDEVIEMAKAEVAKLDATNDKRKATPSKTAVANAPIKEAIVKLLTERQYTMCASDVGATLELTTQKASALLRQLQDEGIVTATEQKVPKKGSVKFYGIA